MTWNVPVQAFTAVGAVRTRAVTVELNEPGTRYLPRVNQVDFGLSKRFALEGQTFEGFFNVFNLNNSSAVITQNNQFGSAGADRPNESRPTALIQPRVVRVGMQWKF
jgi:hypothetical protein